MFTKVYMFDYQDLFESKIEKNNVFGSHDQWMPGMSSTCVNVNLQQ